MHCWWCLQQQTKCFSQPKWGKIQTNNWHHQLYSIVTWGNHQKTYQARHGGILCSSYTSSNPVDTQNDWYDLEDCHSNSVQVEQGKFPPTTKWLCLELCYQHWPEAYLCWWVWVTLQDLSFAWLFPERYIFFLLFFIWCLLILGSQDMRLLWKQMCKEVWSISLIQCL